MSHHDMDLSSTMFAWVLFPISMHVTRRDIEDPMWIRKGVATPEYSGEHGSWTNNFFS